MASDMMNRYWLPNLEINKRVITQELQYYLGPDAHVRPYTREGEDGFLITTPGPCLTDEQIDDICRKSKELWGKQAAARMKKDQGATSEKPLKRPLNQPVLISRAGDPVGRDDRWRRDECRRNGDSDKGSGDERRRYDRRR